MLLSIVLIGWFKKIWFEFFKKCFALRFDFYHSNLKTMENKSAFNWVIHTNFPEADFWLINKGSAKSLGKPVKKFEPFLTGIQCPALIDPEYGYYLCLHLYSINTWSAYSCSSINLKHLRIRDIKEVFQQITNSHRNPKRFVDIKPKLNNASLLVV